MTRKRMPDDLGATLYRDSPRDRYHRDPQFHGLVDYLQAMVHAAQFSPSELREAAILACIMYEERRAGPVYLRRDDDGVVAVAGYPGVRARFCKSCSSFPCVCGKEGK